MKLYIQFSLLSILFLGFNACKHSHPEPSQTLKDAFAVQKSALTELNEIDGLIKNLPESEKAKFVSKKSLWQKNMVEIEGMQHDHSQCDGDHSKKRLSISDDDMLAAQSEWRDSILALKVNILEMVN